MAAVPRPRGGNVAERALVTWCRATKGDTRLKFLLETPDTAAGGEQIGRALRVGGWNGAGLDVVEAMLSGDREVTCAPLVRAFLAGRIDG